MANVPARLAVRSVQEREAGPDFFPPELRPLFFDLARLSFFLSIPSNLRKELLPAEDVEDGDAGSHFCDLG